MTITSIKVFLQEVLIFCRYVWKRLMRHFKIFIFLLSYIKLVRLKINNFKFVFTSLPKSLVVHRIKQFIKIRLLINLFPKIYIFIFINKKTYFQDTFIQPHYSSKNPWQSWKCQSPIIKKNWRQGIASGCNLMKPLIVMKMHILFLMYPFWMSILLLKTFCSLKSLLGTRRSRLWNSWQVYDRKWFIFGKLYRYMC